MGKKRSDKIGEHIVACMKRKGIEGKPKPALVIADDESMREDPTEFELSHDFNPN